MPFSDPVHGEHAFKAYGLGFMLFDYFGDRLACHAGMAGHSMGMVGFVLEKGVGVAVLTNYRPSLFHYAAFRRALDLYCDVEPVDLDTKNRKLLDEHLARRAEAQARRARTRDPEAKPSLPIKAYAGTFEREFGLRSTLTMEAGRLVLRYGDFVADVEHWHDDAFRARLRGPRLPAEQDWYLIFSLEHGRIEKLHIESEHDVQADFVPVPKTTGVETSEARPGVMKSWP